MLLGMLGAPNCCQHAQGHSRHANPLDSQASWCSAPQYYLETLDHLFAAAAPGSWQKGLCPLFAALLRSSHWLPIITAHLTTSHCFQTLLHSARQIIDQGHGFIRVIVLRSINNLFL